jgi:hypothetical protein
MGWLVLLFATILSALPSAAQTYVLSGQIVDSQTNSGLPGATVLLKQDTLVVAGCSTNQDGRFLLNMPRRQDYSIEVKLLGYRPRTIQLTGSVANPAPLRILMPGFCPYAYKRGTVPPCVGGHTDQVVPIVYGLPDAKTMEKAKGGKLHLGGCNLTGCDPKYYCLEHKREL